MPPYITILYVSCFVPMLIIGLLVLHKDVRAQVNRAFFYYAFCQMCWMVFLYTGYAHVPADLPSALFYFRLTYGISVFIPFSLSLFCYRLSPKIWKLPKFLEILFVVYFVTLGFICAFTPLVEAAIHMEGDLQVDDFGPLYQWYFYDSIIFTLLPLLLVAKKIFISRGVERSRLLYISVGFFLFTILTLLTNVVLPLFGIFILQAESVSFSLFFFVAVIYSFYRQRFFQLRYVTLNLIRSTLLISLPVVLLAVTYFFIRSNFDFVDKVFSLITLSVASFLFYRWLDKVFPDLYGPAFRNFKKTMAMLETRLFDMKTFQGLADILEQSFVEKLGIGNARIFVVGSEKLKDGVPLYSPDAFTKYLSTEPDVLLSQEIILKKNTRARKLLLEKLKFFDAALCLPLFSEKRLIGFLTLGQNNKNDTYSREEIGELLKLRPSLQVSLMNILITNTLREENDIMKKIVRERTESLKQNNEKLEQMLQQQENFISLTAHEFRTPLAVAKLGLEQISYLRPNMDPDVAKDVETSHKQLDKLTYLINRLLEMRRVEDDKVPVTAEKFELVALVREIARGSGLLAEAESIHVIFTPPKSKEVVAFNDKVKLQEVIDNLVQNAIKFTPKGGKIYLKLATNKARGIASVTVSDTGVGIPEKDLGVIFEKFQQGSRYNKGIGIGLYLCRQYMHLLHGDITVESDVGHGSTFTITFPLKYAAK